MNRQVVALLLAVCCWLCALASGQVLENAIMLPDTLGPLNGPYCLAWDDNPVHPRLYVGGAGGFYPGQPPEDSGGVIVAEAIACKRLARIPTGPVKALCFVAPHNKLYVAKLNTDTVEVVDCVTNQVVSAVHIACEVPVMQYNARCDRLYCGGSSVSVIDCSADTILHTIPVAASVFALDSARTKLYVGRDGPLTVVDCTGDTVMATIPEIGLDSALCYNPTAKKVYAVSGDTLFAVDTHDDSVVARLAFPGLVPLLPCDANRNRLYCAYSGYWASIDCAGDSVLVSYRVGVTPAHIACNAGRDVLYTTYTAYTPEVDLFNGTTGQYETLVYLDGQSTGITWVPSLDRLYCFLGCPRFDGQL